MTDDMWTFIILLGLIVYVVIGIGFIPYYEDLTLGNTWQVLLTVIIVISGLIGKKIKDKRDAREKEIRHQAYIERISAGNYQTRDEYKYFVALWLKQKGYLDIRITQKYVEGGLDIICIDSQGNKIAVLCELILEPVGYFAAIPPVGFMTIEYALEAMRNCKCDRAMVVTNVSYTEDAIELANKSGVKLWENVISKNNCPLKPLTFCKKEGGIQHI